MRYTLPFWWMVSCARAWELHGSDCRYHTSRLDIPSLACLFFYQATFFLFSVVPFLHVKIPLFPIMCITQQCNSISPGNEKNIQTPKTRTMTIATIGLVPGSGGKSLFILASGRLGSILCYVQVLFRFYKKGLLIQVELVIPAWLSHHAHTTTIFSGFPVIFCFFPFISPIFTK